jgi:hypothetical protein
MNVHSDVERARNKRTLSHEKRGKYYTEGEKSDGTIWDPGWRVAKKR